MFRASESSQRAREALLAVGCPKCGALPGSPCRREGTGKPIPYWTAWHSDRFGAMQEQTGRAT